VIGIYVAHGVTQNVYKQYSESWKMGGPEPHWSLAPQRHTWLDEWVDVCRDRQGDRWIDR